MIARAERLARTLRTVIGWRRMAAAFVFGALAAVALPPAQLWPFAVLAFAALFWLLEGAARPRSGFWIAWAFSFGYFAASLYWIAFALLVDAPKFAWMIPFATLGLSAGLAIAAGLAGWAFVRIGARGLAGALLMAVLWTAGEWLRGHVLTGFPWNLVGTVWGGAPAPMQAAALLGTYGLSLLTVALGALFATAAGRWPIDTPGRTRARWSGPMLATLILAAMWGGGAWRLTNAQAGAVPQIALRLVQPDVPQSLKWDPAARERNFQALLELSMAPGFAGRTHLVWPESAVPFSLDNDARRRLAVASVTPSGGLTITGALRVARDARGGVRLWNSVHAIDGAGALVASYDKFHLVPFGEYVPLRRFLTPLGVEKITAGAIDFSAGPGPMTLDLPGLPAASPLICYEIIFPGEVAAALRPSWLVNLTNDAWFGITAGPHQHFASARFRAVEEGLPVVRVANNGISGVIDAYGRVTAQLALGRRGVLDAALPSALAATPYARYGDMVLAALAVIALFLGWALRRLG